MRSLRIVFFGTPEIAVPTLERLIEGPHEVVGVVSQPDRGRGRGRKLSPSPVARVALEHGLPLLRPEKVGDEETVQALDALAPDAGVVVAFGQFLPKKIREMPTCGYLINAHASLLPKYRGAAPIARAILDGQRETGISVMRVDKEMDAGPIALVAKTPIDPMENAVELSARLADLAASAIAEGVDQIARGEVEWTEQDTSAVTFAAKIEKHDSVLDLRQDARALVARIHALSPKPGGAITLAQEDAADDTTPSEGIVLKISRATSAEHPSYAGAPPEPGTIVLGLELAGDAEGSKPAPLAISTGRGWLLPLVLQRPGGKPLAVEDFLRGFAIEPSMRAALVAPREDTREDTGSESR